MEDSTFVPGRAKKISFPTLQQSMMDLAERFLWWWWSALGKQRVSFAHRPPHQQLSLWLIHNRFRRMPHSTKVIFSNKLSLIDRSTWTNEVVAYIFDDRKAVVVIATVVCSTNYPSFFVEDGWQPPWTNLESRTTKILLFLIPRPRCARQCQLLQHLQATSK